MESIYKVHIPKKGSYETINHMNINMIHRIREAQFFDTEGFENENKMLSKICEEVFMEAYNNGGKEAGAILNFETMEYAICKAKYFNRLVINDNKDSEEYKLLIKASNFSCMCIHTHNSDSSFSLPDVISFLTDTKMTALAVINKNCSIDILLKKNINIDYTNILNSIVKFSWSDVLNSEILEELNNNSILIRRITK